MKIQFDSLELVDILVNKGMDKNQAEAIANALSDIEIHNLYSEKEVSNMIDQNTNKIFDFYERRFEKLEENQKQAIQEMKQYNRRSLEEIKKERRSTTRWLIATVITVGISIAGLIIHT